MYVTDDGTVTGSIDVSKLDQIKPKTPEAEAQLAALKAEVAVGQEQAARDAERMAEVAKRQNPNLFGEPDDAAKEAEEKALKHSQEQQHAADERRKEAERQAAERQAADQKAAAAAKAAQAKSATAGKG